MYQFLAKQGQHNQIAKLLTQNFGKPRLKLYHGTRGDGVMILLNCDASNRTIDRFLFSQNVAGAKARKNRFKIISGTETYDAIEAVHKGKITTDEIFVFALNGKMRKAKVVYQNYGCECCGGWYEVEFV